MLFPLGLPILSRSLGRCPWPLQRPAGFRRFTGLRRSPRAGKRENRKAPGPPEHDSKDRAATPRASRSCALCTAPKGAVQRLGRRSVGRKPVGFTAILALPSLALTFCRPLVILAPWPHIAERAFGACGHLDCLSTGCLFLSHFGAACSLAQRAACFPPKIFY